MVGLLPGSGGYAVGIMCHIDSFFTGACDNASGMAAMIGLAEGLSRLPVGARKADVYLLGLAVKHRGKFVTLDSGVTLGAVVGAKREHLEVITPE